MKKIATLSLLLVGVFFLTGCGQQPVTQTQLTKKAPTVQQPNPSAETQPALETPPALTTYANAKWGFEVGYPTGYEVKIYSERVTDLDLFIGKSGDQEEEKEKNSDDVCVNCLFRLQILKEFIGGSEDGDIKTPEEWVKFQKDAEMGVSYSQTTLNGKTAYTTSEQTAGRRTYLIFVANGVKYDRYDISVIENNNNADTILQSFKLTK